MHNIFPKGMSQFNKNKHSLYIIQNPWCIQQWNGILEVLWSTKSDLETSTNDKGRVNKLL
jgi:hypothetical protein